MNQKLSISVVSDNNLCGDRIIHRLSANPSWNCSRFNDTKKFLSSFDDKFVVDVLVLHYNLFLKKRGGFRESNPGPLLP